MAKELLTVIKLQILAGKANPAPPIGPALGQHGLPIPVFCQQFNAKTAQMGDAVVPVEISVYKDRSFTFILKTPPASYLLIKAAKISKGSGEPNKKKEGKVTMKQIAEIVNIKKKDLNTIDDEKAAKMIIGTARSMGITVEG